METYFDNMTAEEGSKAKLAHDLWVLTNDGKKVLLDTGRATAAAVKAEAKAADALMRKHPYASILVAVGVGMLAGYLLGSRKK
jgi:ElaB/YqjD/DUF883 family membrane-anchored ribosome-binding protein